MKLQTKKIIAKEFLVLTMSIAIGILCFLATYPYNYINSKKAAVFYQEIAERRKVVDSLSHDYKLKIGNQNWFYGKQTAYFPLDDEYNSSDKLWQLIEGIAQSDSIKFRWNNVWDKELISHLKKIGFSSSDELNSFIKSNSISNTDRSNYNQALKIEKVINGIRLKSDQFERNILTYKQQIEFGKKYLLLSVIILFGFRYLYLAIHWSISTLKQKNE